jgi:predicted phage tail protein
MLYIYLITEAYNNENIFFEFLKNTFLITVKNLMVLIITLIIIGVFFWNILFFMGVFLILLGVISFLAVIINIILSMADFF